MITVTKINIPKYEITATEVDAEHLIDFLKWGKHILDTSQPIMPDTTQQEADFKTLVSSIISQI